MGEQLFVQRDRVGFRADKIQRQLRGSATGYQELGFLPCIGFGGFVFGPCR